MARIGFFLISCCLLIVPAARGQFAAYAEQGAAGPYGGPAVVPVAYQQPATMQAGPMQGEQMPAGPMQVAPAGVSPMSAAGGPGCEMCCGCDGGSPQWEAFGDFLYMRPRDANVAYGVLFNSADATHSQIENPPYSGIPTLSLAPAATASIDYHPGFRVGFAKALDECNSVVATFTHWEGEDESSLTAGLPGLVRSLVSQPAVFTSNEEDDFLQANSTYQMIYNLADVDFRWTYSHQNETRLNLLAGIRYASLDQRLDVGGPTQLDVQNIHSQINFEGGGLRVGFEAQRRTPLGLVFYGRTTASVVAGTFRCAYTQSSANNGVEAESGFPADRVVPMLDAELGIGLSLFNDKLRLTSGYSFSGWFNVVRSDEFIGAVQTNNFSGMSNTLTFDGFVSRVELQF